jgi:hypothetical protein
MIVNGIWIVALHPFRDEPQGYAIIGAGFILPVITYYFAEIDDKREA